MYLLSVFLQMRGNSFTYSLELFPSGLTSKSFCKGECRRMRRDCLFPGQATFEFYQGYFSDDFHQPNFI